MSRTLGVGLIGCGLATQAIHLPTLVTMTDRLRVAHMTDVDRHLAETISARVGARHSTSVETLLADPAVDVVAVCTPHQFHAEQVEAACAASKKAILCEKPLATDKESAERIVRSSREHGVPVIVGAMHVYDPAYRLATASWVDLPQTATLVRSVILLPPNERFVGAATEIHLSPVLTPGPDAAESTQVTAATLRRLILGLASHDLPLVRQFAKTIDEVVSARVLAPLGYDLAFISGDCVVQLTAAFHEHWRADWSFEVWGARRELRVDFTPAFVRAGSATATLREPGHDRRWCSEINGYQAEWQHVADVATGRCAPMVSVEDAADDLVYGLKLVEATGRMLETV